MTPQDVVQSAMLVGVSTPNAFAKHKNLDMNGGEGAATDDSHAREEDMVSTKKPIAVHPKLITGKESKRGYRQRYRLPFMTRSAARKERAAAGLERPSQHPNLKHPAHIPIWAQTATSQPNSRGLDPEAPTFIPMPAIQVKSSRHPEAKGPVHIPIWAREETTQEGLIPHLSPEATVPVPTHPQKLTTQASAQHLDCKGPQNLSTSAEHAATLCASIADTINVKDQREFAQPRFSIYDDMDMKPPCALKVTLNARSYSKKTAIPITTYKARGNSGNIIGMNYLKARQALHQLGPNRKLGWYTIWTVNLDTKAEVNSVRAKVLAGIRVQSDNSRKRRSNDDSFFELLLRKDRLPVDEYNKTRRIEEHGTEKEFKFHFSDRSSSSSPKSVSESTSEELRAKAVSSSCSFTLSCCYLIYRKDMVGFNRAPSLSLSAELC